jgi:hypothetical protein
VKVQSDFRMNGVTATSDGTIIANVQMKGGASSGLHGGKITGGVYVWKLSEQDLALQPAPNWPAITASRFRATKSRSMSPCPAPKAWKYFSRRHRQDARTALAGWFNIDNIHWTGNRLVDGG